MDLSLSEPSNGISLYRGKVEKVCRQAVLNALTGIYQMDFRGGRTKNTKERYQRVQENHPEKVIVLRPAKETDHFRKSLA